MKLVTLDTNVLPVGDLLRLAPPGRFDFALISVTGEETTGTSFAVCLEVVGSVSKSIAYGQGRYGVHVYGGAPDPVCCEKALAVISNGSFPPRLSGGT